MSQVLSSTFTSSAPEVDGRINITETHTTDDGQIYAYTWLCDLNTTNPQMVLDERVIVINETLAQRQVAHDLVQGTLVPMTRFEFLNRFEPQERIAVRAAATTDPVIFDFMDLLSQSGNVTHEHARTGLAYLVSVGLLSQDRANAIGAA